MVNINRQSAGACRTRKLIVCREHNHEDFFIGHLLTLRPYVQVWVAWVQKFVFTAFVETTQVAPTILQALGLDPNHLDAVKKEGTAVLPGLNFRDE